MKHIDEVVMKARRVLHGRAKGRVVKSYHPKGLWYAEVWFTYQGSGFKAVFFRMKGKKQWEFDSMVKV